MTRSYSGRVRLPTNAVTDCLHHAFKAWLAVNGLGDAEDAAALIMSDAAMTDAQRLWLDRWIALWAVTEG